MKNFHEKFNGVPAIILGIVALGGVAYGAYDTYDNLEKEKSQILSELDTEREVNYGLMLSLREKEGIIDSFQGQISEITGAVGTLEKLAATDEELLRKYSKVYFLNENYIPSKLVEIEDKYLVDTATNDQLHADVYLHLKNLLQAAAKDGIDIKVASAYRSYGTQSALKASYRFSYGSGANTFSADQGYSEHQLGTTVDLSAGDSGISSTFVASGEYEWLKNNAHDYGFTLSYPENNNYYTFEPWHWRYVGRELASRLRDENKHFYDLDQRVIDTYLIKLFD